MEKGRNMVTKMVPRHLQGGAGGGGGRARRALLRGGKAGWVVTVTPSGARGVRATANPETRTRTPSRGGKSKRNPRSITHILQKWGTYE